MEMDSLVERFVERLHEAELVAPVGASLEQIRRFEARYRVQIPGDMVRFFVRVNGMKTGEMDPDSYVRLWSLEELSPLTTHLPEYSRSVDNADHAFVIADFLIWSMGYVSWLPATSVSSAPVYLVGEQPPIRVAESFAEFLELYIANPAGLVPRKQGVSPP
jgi:hypothetical protein